MEQTVFLFKPYGEYEQHKVVKLPVKEAEQLKTEGLAVETSRGKYDDFREQAKQLHSKFKREETKIKQKDHPLQTKEVKEYELKQLNKQYRKESEALEAEYRKYREQAIEEAHTKAAQASISVRESDKQVAEQLSNRLALSAQTAVGDSAKSEFITQAKRDISKLSDEQKTALQGCIGKVLDKIDDSKHQRAIINEVSDVRNMDLLGAKAAEQLPYTANIEYTRVKVADKAYKANRIVGQTQK
ncbi:hypothetical protein [Sediminibacillus massiliensis]|uniref:hypothetical protein n=1 Tax=Sediminibacillus massiliensis TaxID=1926277 RepID=UPI000988424A|nr:hypothetical protein [Sediminibacillus massiliensis]